MELLQCQAPSRVVELLPLRYGRMVASPFTFYRGAALVMAADLASTTHSGLQVQLCGDAHLSNFGFFASPERHLLFDLNDFDETLPGPFEWDVKRLAASLEIAARSRSFRDKERRAIVLAAARSYRETMRQFARRANLDVWYARADADQIFAELRATLSAKQLRRMEAVLTKARSRDSLQAFAKLTEVVDGQVGIVADPPLIVPVEICSPARTSIRSTSRWGGCCGPTVTALALTVSTCSTSIGWCTWHARWSVWAVSEPAPGSCCSRA